MYLNMSRNNTFLPNNISSSSIECPPIPPDFLKDAPKGFQMALLAVSSSIGLVSLTVNSLVIWAIVKTRGCRQQATKLICIASTIDLAYLISGNLFVGIYISIDPTRSPCVLRPFSVLFSLLVQQYF